MPPTDNQNHILNPLLLKKNSWMVDHSCMCTKTAMELVYNLMSTSEPPVTDLNPYMKFVTQVMDKLQCSSLDNMVFYPHPTCPVARRLGLFA